MAIQPYATVEEADAYYTEGFGYDSWLSTSPKLKLLVSATRLMDRFISWEGVKTDATQETKWPRAGVYDDEMQLIASDTIPVFVQHICCEIAYQLLSYGGFDGPEVPVVFQAGSLKVQNDMSRVSDNVFTSQIRALISASGGRIDDLTSSRSASVVSVVRS
jgi:hypothetical protein